MYGSSCSPMVHRIPLPLHALHGALQIVVPHGIDLFQRPLGVIGRRGGVRHGLHGLRAQVLPHGSEQGHAQGVPLHLIVHVHQGV